MGEPAPPVATPPEAPPPPVAPVIGLGPAVKPPVPVLGRRPLGGRVAPGPCVSGGLGGAGACANASGAGSARGAGTLSHGRARAFAGPRGGVAIRTGEPFAALPLRLRALPVPDAEPLPGCGDPRRDDVVSTAGSGAATSALCDGCGSNIPPLRSWAGTAAATASAPAAMTMALPGPAKPVAAAPPDAPPLAGDGAATMSPATARSRLACASSVATSPVVSSPNRPASAARAPGGRRARRTAGSSLRKMPRGLCSSNSSDSS